MIFSTPFFLFCYLPVVLLVYYAMPLKVRNLVLLIVSLVFYAWGEPIYILIMILSIIIDYVHGILINRYKKIGSDKKARIAVATSILFNLSLLLFFKYWDFIAVSLASVGLDFMPVLGLELPIGISFFTFQTMSYSIDVYRGDSKVQKNLITFGSFVTMFPQLIAGPIIKFKEVAGQLENRTYNYERFASGSIRFVKGLCKKVLLANNFGLLWETFGSVSGSNLTTLGAWLGIIGYALQLYFDFSGYSDMAIGLGRMLGFEFPENFNYPYIAKSISDFWRRWHISLTTWFREYLYIPLGGNREGTSKTIRNLLIVWLATGIWHGASWNFFLWGIYYFFLIVMEKYIIGKVLKKIPKWIGHFYTLFFVLVGWTIFAVGDMSGIGGYLSSMFGFGTRLLDGVFLYNLRNYAVLLVVGVIAVTPLSRRVWSKIPERISRIVGPVVMIAGLILVIAYLIDGSYNPFLYFEF